MAKISLKFLLVFGFFLMVLLAGCAAQPEKQPEKKEDKKEVKPPPPAPPAVIGNGSQAISSKDIPSVNQSKAKELDKLADVFKTPAPTSTPNKTGNASNTTK